MSATTGDEKQPVGGLDEPQHGGNIKLLSKDNKSFELLKKNSLISTLIKTSLDTDPTATDVPIPGVVGEILEKVIEYMNHHNGVEPVIIEKPLRSKVLKEVVKDEWDAIYIDNIGDNRQQLYDVILAANYMDVKSLLHLGCAKVASLIKGQPLEKIKEILTTGIKKEGEEKEGSQSGSSAIVASYAAPSSSSSSPASSSSSLAFSSATAAAAHTEEPPTAIRQGPSSSSMVDDDRHTLT